MTTFLIICLLIMPWVFLPIRGIVNQFRLPQGIFLNFIFLGLIFFWIKNGIEIVYKNKYLAFLSLWIFLHISLFLLIPLGIEFTTSTGVVGRNLNTWILEPTIHFLLGVFGVMILLSTIREEDYIRIAKTLCISAFFVSIFSILQYIGLDPLVSIAQYNCGNKVSACLDNPNLVGGYLALTLPFFLLFKQTRYWIGFLISLVGLYVTKSHFAQGCAIVGVITWLLLKYRRNKYIIGSIILFIILGAIFIINTDYLKLSDFMSGRLICWKFAFEKLKVNPLLGQSLGTFKVWEFKTYGGGVNVSTKPLVNGQPFTLWFNAHNDWLQYTVELGILGISLFVLLIWNTIKNFSYKNETGYVYFASFITFLILMVASFPFEVPSLAILGILAFCGAEKL